MKLTRSGMLGALLVAAVGMAGCSETSGPSSGRLVVRMTDAPFPFSEVKNVNVFVVRVDGRRDAASDSEIEDENNMSGWVTVAEPNAAFDLLTLQGGVTTNLGSATLATGTYNSFRLILDTGQSTIVLNDGSEVNVQWPSAGQTGIKVNLDAPIQVVQDSSVMILDFDVGRSFVLRGNSIRNNGLLFKPVIRATASELTGSIAGNVRSGAADGPVVADATVELLKDGTALGDTDENNVVATTSTDASGSFRFAFILPGPYEIRVTPPDGSGLAPALLSGGVTAISGTEVTTAVIVLTAP